VEKKTKNISYQEFIDKVHLIHSQMGGKWRLGQTYFNVLCNLRPAIAESIRSTIHDTFNKEVIPKELEQLVSSQW
jgi:hypothetical protein